MKSFALEPPSKPLLTSSTEVWKAIADFKVSNAPGPNGTSKRDSINVSKERDFLVKAGYRTTTAVVLYTYQLLDTVRKIFDKILLPKLMAEINSWDLQRDRQFSFRPKLNKTQQKTQILERIKINFYEKRLTAAVFLDVGKFFYFVWIEDLL